MLTCILDGTQITDKKMLHDILAASLQLPDWYGRNLDALHDCLTDIQEAVEIQIVNMEKMEEHLGGYARTLAGIIHEASRENPKIRYYDRRNPSMNYQDINSETIDSWCQEGWEWGTPISHETYAEALKGNWGVYLTPTKTVPHQWFGSLYGKKLLGLASGGGQQLPVFKALGADCTLLDYSRQQCESELLVAEREGYEINILQADMTKPLPFPEDSFDLIFHPVSNCYVEKVEPIFKECHRILKKGGILLCGLDIGINYAFNEEGTEIINSLPFNPLRDEALYLASIENNEGIQFSHTLEEQIGGQLTAGFRLTDLYEDTNGYGNLHEHNIPTFIATRSIK